jgi:multidrug efflux system membrane fusion protein
VKLGISQGNDVAIDDGLSPNERVVVDGAEKLTEGMQVSVHQPGETPSAGQPSGRRSRRGAE